MLFQKPFYPNSPSPKQSWALSMSPVAPTDRPTELTKRSARLMRRPGFRIHRFTNVPGGQLWLFEPKPQRAQGTAQMGLPQTNSRTRVWKPKALLLKMKDCGMGVWSWNNLLESKLLQCFNEFDRSSPFPKPPIQMRAPNVRNRTAWKLDWSLLAGRQPRPAVAGRGRV